MRIGVGLLTTVLCIVILASTWLVIQRYSISLVIPAAILYHYVLPRVETWIQNRRFDLLTYIEGQSRTQHEDRDSILREYHQFVGTAQCGSRSQSGGGHQLPSFLRSSPFSGKLSAALPTHNDSSDPRHLVNKMSQHSRTPYVKYAEKVTASEWAALSHSTFHFNESIVLVGSSVAEDAVEIGLKLSKIEEIHSLSCLPVKGMRVWLLQGFGLANILVLEGHESLALVDTSELPEMLFSSLDFFHKVSKCQPEQKRKLVSKIFISHSHADHTGGIMGARTYNEYAGSGDSKPMVIGSPETQEATITFFMERPLLKFIRAQKQFGTSKHIKDVAAYIESKPPMISAGIGTTMKFERAAQQAGKDMDQVGLLTHIFEGDTANLEHEGHTIEMMKMPGETDDHVCFFLPSLKIFHISDNFYFAFPSVYPLRGGKPRNVQKWVQSLDQFIQRYSEKTQVLTMGHTSPIFGSNVIRPMIIRYRDGLQFVHHQTLRLLNSEEEADKIASKVTSLFWQYFPRFYGLKRYAESASAMNVGIADPLLPFYGQIQWAVKAIVFNEIGWFNGNVGLINSHKISSTRRHRKLRTLLRDKSSLIDRIVDSIRQNDCQWALELAQLGLESQNADDGLEWMNMNLSFCEDESDPIATDLSTLDYEEYQNWERDMCKSYEAKKSQLNARLESIPDDDLNDIVETSCADNSNTMTEGTLIKCLHRESIFCLARHELSATGRNWYLSSILTEAQEDRERLESILSARKMRKKVVLNPFTLKHVLRSLPSRLNPRLSPKSNKPFLLFCNFYGANSDNSTERASKTSDSTMSVLRELISPVEQPLTMEFLFRNGVMNVNEIASTTDVDWQALRESQFFEINMSWDALQKIILRDASPLKLWLQGHIHAHSWNYPSQVGEEVARKHISEIKNYTQSDLWKLYFTFIRHLFSLEQE